MWEGQLLATLLAEQLRDRLIVRGPGHALGWWLPQLQECLRVFCCSLALTSFPWDCCLFPCKHRVRTNLLSCGFHCCWAPLLIFQVRWVSFPVFKSNYGNKRLLSAPWRAAIRALILSVWARSEKWRDDAPSLPGLEAVDLQRGKS